ncbi:cell wall hydrolase [Hyphomonas sp. TMED31]|tara:strand:+ start:2491 stop:3600 length:1110 start_codon:yes stop_codon:yes gene_type:complete
MRGLQEQLKRWWMAMTNEEQRDIVVRGATIAVCAVAATVTLPVIGELQLEKRAEADFRAEAMRLATIEDGGVTVRSDPMTPSLLDTPWIRTVEYTLKRDTDSSMSRYAMRDRDGAALSSLVSFRPEHIKRAEKINDEAKCLSQAIYYEAGTESLGGKMAVAEVIANRVRDHRYPDSICDVVFQGATRTTGCQFTFTCDGAMNRAPRGRNWDTSQKVAAHVLMNLNEERTGGATHYHATYVDPIWSAGLIKTDKIGLHIFYRFPRGAEWAQVRQNYNNKRARVITAAADRDVNAAATSVIKTQDEAKVQKVAMDAPAPTLAPASVTTSTRTITNGAPKFNAVRKSSNVSSYQTAQVTRAAAGAGATGGLN